MSWGFVFNNLFKKADGVEDYIRNDRTNRYNIMCYINSHDKLLPTYVYYAISGGGRAIPKNATTAVL